MMGLEGVFVARTGEQRVMLLLDLMGKASRVQIDVDAIHDRFINNYIYHDLVDLPEHDGFLITDLRFLWIK